jgi:hypothetical protein
MTQSAIDNAVELSTDLWQVVDFFPTEMLAKIMSTVEQETQWDLQEMQEHMPRRVLPWKTNGILDDIYGYLDSLDYSKFGIKFANVRIWKDLPGYCISPHIDNPGVQASLQLYLNPGPKEIGTWFDDVEIPYVQNSGYIMNNRLKLSHGMQHPVPENFTRYSLYALFTNV